MSDVALAFRQVKYENKSFWRNPASMFFTFIFPLMFLVIFNLLFGGKVRIATGQTVNASYFYVPAIAAFSIVTACFTNTAMSITLLRDQGVLKRSQGSPLPGWAFLLGRIMFAVIIAILLVLIVTAAGVLFYNVNAPTDTMGPFVLSVIVGAASFCALGFAITSVIPNGDAAPAMVNGIVLPLLFISDVFVPLDKAPQWIVTLGDIFPIKHLSHAVTYAFNPPANASAFRGTDLLVVAIWGIAGLLIASRFFTWEPRR
ncbi:MAG: ABC transporter permease [Actinomycetota bacterium]|nr:ABC transporter permease [Actinomycetota bacterium]